MLAKIGRNTKKLSVHSYLVSPRTLFAPALALFESYTDARFLFVLGHHNQNELSFEIDYFITADSQIEHLHNQLVAAIYGNICRDAPEPGVAPWVSANDKPTIVSKPVTGDAAETRLKTEVMQLPLKDRRRLKAITEVSLLDCVTFSSLRKTWGSG